MAEYLDVFALKMKIKERFDPSEFDKQGRPQRYTQAAQDDARHYFMDMCGEIAHDRAIYSPPGEKLPPTSHMDVVDVVASYMSQAEKDLLYYAIHERRRKFDLQVRTSVWMVGICALCVGFHYLLKR